MARSVGILAQFSRTLGRARMTWKGLRPYGRHVQCPECGDSSKVWGLAPGSECGKCGAVLPSRREQQGNDNANTSASIHTSSVWWWNPKQKKYKKTGPWTGCSVCGAWVYDDKTEHRPACKCGKAWECGKQVEGSPTTTAIDQAVRAALAPVLALVGGLGLPDGQPLQTQLEERLQEIMQPALAARSAEQAKDTPKQQSAALQAASKEYEQAVKREREAAQKRVRLAKRLADLQSQCADTKLQVEAAEEEQKREGQEVVDTKLAYDKLCDEQVAGAQRAQKKSAAASSVAGGVAELPLDTRTEPQKRSADGNEQEEDGDNTMGLDEGWLGQQTVEDTWSSGLDQAQQSALRAHMLQIANASAKKARHRSSPYGAGAAAGSSVVADVAPGVVQQLAQAAETAANGLQAAIQSNAQLAGATGGPGAGVGAG